MHPTRLHQPSPYVALSTDVCAASRWKRIRIRFRRPGRANCPGKAGYPSSNNTEKEEETQQEIIPTMRKKNLCLHAITTHPRTNQASAGRPPDTIARNLDEVRGSLTPLAPRRRQGPDRKWSPKKLIRMRRRRNGLGSDSLNPNPTENPSDTQI